MYDKKRRFAIYTKSVLLFFTISFFFIGTGFLMAAEPSDFRLIGIIQSKAFGGVVLQDPTGKQTFFRLYEKIPDGSKIIELRTDNILLRDPDGGTYYMFIAHNTKTAASSIPAVANSNYTEPAAIQESKLPDHQKMGNRYKRQRQTRALRHTEEED